MAPKQTRPRAQAEFRQRSQIPLPAVDEVAQRLMAVLSPSLLALHPWERRAPRPAQGLSRMRQRLWTRPVMGRVS